MLLPAGDWVRPAVLLLGASWLRVEASSMPVFESGLALAWHIRRQCCRPVLSPEHVELLSEAVVNAKPLAVGAARSPGRGAAPGVRVRQGRTRDGHMYVVVEGAHADVEEVRRSYVDRGLNAGPVRADRSGQGWFSYINPGRPDLSCGPVASRGPCGAR